MTEFPIFPSAYWCTCRAEQPALVWQRGECELFADLPERISWAQLHRRVTQVCVGLVAKLQRHAEAFTVDQTLSNKTVAYLGEGRLAALLCYLAVIAGGGRVLMLNPAMPCELQATLSAEIGVDMWVNEADIADFTDFDSFSTACCMPAFLPNQPASLTLTSGSSGLPKAVVHSIAQHLANAEGVCALMGFSAADRWLLSLPLFHVSGQGIVWRWLSQGATLMVGEDKAQFYTQLAACSHASLVPTQLKRYLAHQREVQIQHILLGGAALPPSLLAAAQKQGICTYAGYGLTEMASTVCAAAGALDHVGQPLAHRAVKLVAEEIYLRGDCLALGYWRKGELIPLTLENGWFATRDRGKWNAEGQLEVLGRLDNLFISGGENIQPEAVEQSLYRSSLLNQIVVLPVDDAEFGQRPVALVEFKQGFSSQAVENLRQFAQQVLEKFKQPIAYYPLQPEWTQGGIKLSRRVLQAHLARLLHEKRHETLS